MSDVLTIATKEIVSTAPTETIQQAAEKMTQNKIGACVVLDGEKLVGILSERDILSKVVAKKMQPDTTIVKDVMTSAVQTIEQSASTDDALNFMHQGKFRHLPVVDESGKVVGILSVRDLLKKRIEDLRDENKSLAAFITADGPGG